jgi:hypothetical protein
MDDKSKDVFLIEYRWYEYPHDSNPRYDFKQEYFDDVYTFQNRYEELNENSKTIENVVNLKVWKGTLFKAIHVIILN